MSIPFVSLLRSGRLPPRPQAWHEGVQLLLVSLVLAVFHASPAPKPWLHIQTLERVQRNFIASEEGWHRLDQ